MTTGEGDQVDGELAQIGVELTGEAEGASDTAHDGRHEMAEISECGGGELQSAEADVVRAKRRRQNACVRNGSVENLRRSRR